LKNTHESADFGSYFSLIDTIFRNLNGNATRTKRRQLLKPDAYFGQEYNFLFEFDEFQHFSTAREKTLLLFPARLSLAFNLYEYQQYCQMYALQADQYRRNKQTVDFPFEGGRTAQRAYLDCFRDILPPLHGLKPTVRIAAFEVAGITSDNRASRAHITKILEKRLVPNV
jgi:hypothetical protein